MAKSTLTTDALGSRAYRGLDPNRDRKAALITRILDHHRVHGWGPAYLSIRETALWSLTPDQLARELPEARDANAAQHARSA